MLQSFKKLSNVKGKASIEELLDCPSAVRAIPAVAAENRDEPCLDRRPYARNAYNSARDQMEVDGEDVSDMDTSAEVLKQVMAMKKG
jgi:hypothetical protein